MNSTAALYEILYLIIAVPAALASLHNLYDYVKDLRALYRRKRNGARRSAAWLMVRSEIGRLIVFATMILIAARALNAPNVPLEGFRLLTVAMFYLLMIWKAVGAFLDRRAREIVRAELGK
jgi:hypothetical protein